MTRFADLCREFDSLAAKVGLQRSAVPNVVEAGLSHPNALWRGTYAQCLALELPDLEESTFSTAWRAAQDLLDACLQRQEEDGSGPVDGYLIMVLPRPPGDALRKLVNRAELDTNVCRKHVTWPDQLGSLDSDWAGLLLTTVLGLPEAPEPLNVAAPPELQPAAQDLLSRIEDLGPRRAARIDLGEE